MAGNVPLTCSTTSCPLTGNPTYIWYKNGQVVTENTLHYSVYPEAVDSYFCAVKGHEDLHSPAVCVQGQSCSRVNYTNRSICALKGSTVDISCTYVGYYYTKSSFWFRSDKSTPEDLTRDPGYADRVEYTGQTEYQYSVSRGGSDSYSYASSLSCLRVTYTSRSICSLIPSVDLPCTTIYPTDLQVKVTPGTEAWKRTLTCTTSCTLTDNPTYIWYRNGQSLDWLTSQQHSVWSSETESYSCAVKGHEDLRSPAVCVQGHNCWRVTYTKRRICVLKGSTVDISCSYTHPTSYIEQGSFWFTQKHPVDVRSYPESAGRVEYNRNTENHHTMTITHLTEKDSAEYKFRLITTKEGRFSGLPGVMLTVTDILLEMDPTSVSEGGWVTLRCRTQCTVGLNPTYIWYKNGQSLTNPITSYNSLILDPVSSEDAGNYSCAVEGLERILSPEETLTVRYGPKNTSVSVSPSGELVEGSSVTLTCSSDANPPVQSYTWYKKNVTSPKASGQSYNITNIISEDRGEYYCEAENIIASNNSTALMIIVAGKQTSVVTAAVGIIVVVLVLILCLSGLMWFRKKASKPTNTRDTSDDGQGDSSPVYDNISNMAMTSTAAQTADTDNQDGVHYASVHFSGSKNQEVPLYSTVQLHQPQKQDQDVQYAAVKFNLPSSATQQAAAQAAEVDASEIYSTVNKPRTKKT
ncbi:B-cell receptor CD22-like [Oncorhynchus masou masou]|uniref:B-cell receptor CD22-like n=1 Tax=Oncorhynchus masou masou TaxID=90313 RepID=UPI003182EFCB